MQKILHSIEFETETLLSAKLVALLCKNIVFSKGWSLYFLIFSSSDSS